VKKEFDTGRANPPIPPLHPRSAGTAIWVKGLHNRIRSQHAALQQSQAVKSFAADTCTEALNEYNQVSNALEEYTKKVCFFE
jgi:hypothetical protein